MSVGLSIAMTAAQSALKTSQKQLTIISNNIAQSDNENYHRQSAIVTNSVMVVGDNAFYGTGSYVSSIVRYYNESLEKSLRTATSASSYADSYYSSLSNMEDILATDGESTLNNSMSGFASALEAVAANPEETSYRETFIASSEALADTFNLQYNNLANLRDSIATNDSTGSGELSTSCDEANSILDQIAKLNDSISTYENSLSNIGDANTLRDERDALCKELSKYVSVTISEESNSKYTIELNLAAGTATLIDGTTAGVTTADHLVMAMTETSIGFYTPHMELASAAGVTVNLAPENGSIQAMLDGRAEIVTQMDALYTFASSLSTAINTIQNSATGYDLYGNNNAGDLFQVETTGGGDQPASGNILTVLISDPKSIAASTSATEQGNGENAGAMWDKLDEAGTISGDSYLDHAQRLITSLAIDVSSAESTSDTLDSVTAMYQSSVDDYSGVSTDEELTNMLTIQRVYQAAARIITAVDEMMEIAINMV
ncbi:MAG: flagellar hook-associated protein FlgK [Lentisphaerae bacterium GWF2_44_16]|nr:MAG: flagellar hook-associated protein FlgK [Lentisphaerae bacterium GWF2_44_16]